MGSSAPTRLGRYDVLLPLGSGGMASVYLATASGVGGFEREVAIKVLHPHLREQPELSHDLIEEAKLAARIRHPNVTPVLEAAEDPEGVFLVMEYVEGDTLSYLLRAAAGQLPIPVTLRLLADALAGLHAAHELRGSNNEPLSVVHRDFSPQNILVGLDGVARLTDFGIARASSRAALTKTGLVKGKVAYMSPEQARGEKLDRRADVWAAGVVVWEILTGRRFLDMESEVAMIANLISNSAVPRARDVRPEIPQALDDALAHALMRDPAKRMTDVNQLREALLTAWKRPAETSEVALAVQQYIGPRIAQRREAARSARAGAAPAVVATSLPAEAPVSNTKRAIRVRRSWLVPVVIAGVMGLALSLGAIVVLSRSEVKSEAKSGAVPSALPPTLPLVAEPPPASEPETLEVAGSSSTPATTPPAADVPDDRIVVEANAPIVALALNGKSIALADATKHVDAPVDRGAEVRIVARSKDGRRADGHGHAGTTVRLVFPAPAAAAPAPRPAPAPAPAPAGPKLIMDPYNRNK